MSSAIDARQVNSDGPQLSSSNICRKEEINPSIEQQRLFRLIQGLNRFDSIDPHSFTNSNRVPPTQTKTFYRPFSPTPLNSNQPSTYLHQHQTRISSIRPNSNTQTQTSPIRRISQTEQKPQIHHNDSQPNHAMTHQHFQSLSSNTPIKNQFNLRPNSVTEYFSGNPSNYPQKNLERPQTQVIYAGSIDRNHYSFGDQYKKYRVGSQNDTKTNTQRDGDNVTGLSSLNSSYKKIANFSVGNDNNHLPLIRPYSTFNLTSCPESLNPIEWNRSVSYQQQNVRLNNLQQNQTGNRSGMNHLTALESEGVIEQDARYARTYVDRPFTGYQNETHFAPIQKPQTKLSQGAYLNNRIHSRQVNLRESNVNRQIQLEPHQVIFSNISEIKRPHYESKRVEKREMRKLGGEEEPKLVFQNNWVLLALLLLLLLGLVSLGVWLGSNSYAESHKYTASLGQIMDIQPGVRPTLVDPAQIKHSNTTESTNQNTTNTQNPALPAQYPPISINTTIVNPETETTNDSIVKPQNPNPQIDISVLPQQVPIVFPPIEDGTQTISNESLVSNVTQKPVIIEPTKVPTENTKVNLQRNTTVEKPINTTETPAKPILPIVLPSTNLTQSNLTVINPSISKQPLKIPTQPIQNPIKPSETAIDPAKTPTIEIIPASPNVTEIISNVTVNQPKPIEEEASAQYIEAQKFQQPSEYEGYYANGYYYYPIEQKEDFSIEPTIVLQNLPIEKVGVTAFEPTITVPAYEPTIKVPTIQPIITVPAIQPSIIEPTLIPSPTYIKPISQEIPSYTNDYVEPQSVSDFQVSVDPIMEEVNFQTNKNDSVPFGDSSISIEPAIADANLQITQPQDIQAKILPEFMLAEIQTEEFISPITFPGQLGQINAEIIPQDNQMMDISAIRPSVTDIIETQGITFENLMNDSIITEVTPSEVIPQAIQPEILPIIAKPQVIIQPQTIPVYILPQMTTSEYVTPIPVTSDQSNTQFISPQPIQIQTIPTQSSNIQPTIIEPQNPSIPSLLQPSITEIQPEPTNFNAKPIQPIQQSSSIEPHTIIISETNFTDPTEFIMNRVKRLTPITQPQVIYQIPQGYDKSKLAQIQKNFLAFYNKTLQQKSPLEIIPLSWKDVKDSTLLTQNQYPIYYTHKRMENLEQVNYLPSKLYHQTMTSSLIKETIVEISPFGQMIVLQKGTDWPQVKKNMHKYSISSIQTEILPKTLKHKYRHSLRRQH